MFHKDHNPPHFHVEYGNIEATINIKNLTLLTGRLSPRVMGLVIEWASIHQSELLSEWEKAKSRQELGKIDPLE